MSVVFLVFIFLHAFFFLFRLFRLRFRHAGWLQLRNLADGISRQSLALCLEALHTYKVAGFQNECFAEAVVSAKVYLDARVHLTGQQDKLRMFVVAQEILFLGGCFEGEAFQVRIVLLVGIIEHGCPYLIWIEFLDTENIRVVMVAQVEVGSIEFSVLIYH